jgi:hypothetical protein
MIRPFLLILLFFVTSDSLCLAVSAQPAPVTEEEVLREANRTLEQELKLAGRPQIYLVLDLSEGVLLIKGRGLELYRFGILHWELSAGAELAHIFRLQARPAVRRPELAPGEDAAETVISLDDMPAEYLLAFEPNLWLAVTPPAFEQPWLWARSRLRELGSRLGAVKGPAPVRLRVTLTKDDVRSLAWSVVEGMPLIIRRDPRRLISS